MQAPLSFGLVLWAAFAALYLACFTLLAALAAATLGRRSAGLRRALIGTPGLGLPLPAILWNRGAFRALLSLQGWQQPACPRLKDFTIRSPARRR